MEKFEVLDIIKSKLNEYKEIELMISVLERKCYIDFKMSNLNDTSTLARINYTETTYQLIKEALVKRQEQLKEELQQIEKAVISVVSIKEILNEIK